MKHYSLILFFLLFGFSVIAQSRLDSLSSERNAIYQKYREHKDTITVNTWLNIFKLNKYLEQIVLHDSLINNEILNSQVNNDLVVTQSKLESLINEKKDLNKRLSEAEKVKENSGKNLLASIIAGSAAFALLIVFLVFYILSLSKVKKNNSLMKEYHTNLYTAKAEIELLQKDQMVMAGEINSREKSFEEELRKTKEKISFLSDEKVMLENQIVEIKKAYDHEVERRTLAEEKLLSVELQNAGNKRPDNLENTGFSIEGQSDLERLSVENNLLTDNLKMANDELDKQKNLRLGIENELRNLLEKLRGHHS